MEKFFKLRENGTTFSREVVAGLTTFFAMAYIIFVNPDMLSQTGMPYQAVFLATIIASIAGTLVMGLFANVPYAQAPGMGLNAFFTYTVCFGLGFSWQQALAMVFICGIINIVITVTKIRKSIIKAIPPSLQNAIGGGIGLFIAYIGLKLGGLLNFTFDPGHSIDVGGGTILGDASGVPGMVALNNPAVLLFLFGLIFTVILMVKKVRGAIFIGIVVTTLVGIPLKVVDLSTFGAPHASLAASFADLGTTFGAAFGADGLGSLFSDLSKLPTVLLTIFCFSLSDTFDTIGTFIGTGRRTGIFTDEDLDTMDKSSGFKSKMDRALFADSVATSVGAVFGTSNTTTYVESAAGIAAGGRTGLTSVVTSVMFLAAMFLAPIAGIVPSAATAPALIVVGVLMLASFLDVKWDEFDVAFPAFCAGALMAFLYSISTGIAFAFIAYCLIKVVKKETKELSPILIVATVLFIANFVIMAII